MILSIFYVSHALFELPSMVLRMWIGPGWYLPLTTVGFGIVTIGTAFCETKGQALPNHQSPLDLDPEQFQQ